MEKKKIAFFIDSLNCGGAVKSLTTLVRLLDGKYDVKIYVVKGNGTFETFIPKTIPINLIEIPKFSIGQRIRKACFTFVNKELAKDGLIQSVETYWKYYGRYIPNMEDTFDVAIAYQQGFPTYYVFEKVKAQKKICWINADISSQGYNPDFNTKMYEGYDSVVAVSEKLKEMLLYDYPTLYGKLYVINDIVPASLIFELSKELIADLDPSIITLTTVGRLVPVKGYNLAIDAAAILRDKGYDFKWYFVGDGILRPQIETKINKLGLKEFIILTGSINNPYPYIAKADVYIQPSISEGFGIALSEAKVLRRPIVSTDFEVVHNLITDNENGLICKKDAKAIAQSIERLINDVALRTHFSKNLEKELNTKSEDTELNRVIELIEITR